MPLSAVCVSTVGGRHKNWSAAKDAQDFITMNNSEEICTYQENGRRIYAPVKKPAYFEYDISDDKPSKKEKKWSFGNLFRRKKKSNDSSSDEETKDKNRRKSEKRKKPITFDHVVIPQSQSQIKFPEVRGTPTEKAEDSSLLKSQETPNQSKSYISDNQTKHQPAGQFEQTKVKSRTSLDNLSRKSRKDLAKVRAEARRTSINRNSSSDEDSQRSNSSQKFRSDESLYRTRDASANRRTRAARTERYLKRHSRDGENPNNYLRISKSDAESTFLRVSDDSNRSPSASPQLLKSSFSSLSSQTPSVMGLSTIPPSHTHHGRFKVSNSTSNPSYKPPLSINDYNNSSKIPTSQKENVMFNNQRSISFDANIHRPQDHQEVIYAKLELGKPTRNLTLMDNTQLRRYYNVYQPPAPPPRDPKRLHGSLILDTLNHNNSHDNVPTRYNFHNESIFQVKRVNSINRPAFKSSSENHIPRENPVILSQRPSSTTPETTIRRNGTTDVPLRSDNNYQYLTDKQPRSRKPILIQNDSKKHQETKDKLRESRNNFPSRDSSSFLEQLQAKKSNRYSRGNSPKILNSETKLQTEIFLPSVLPNSIGENKNVQQKLNDKNENLKQQDLDLVNQNSIISVEAETSQAKSANLEEALNELEAIYNSLKLGDENLLEMAEKRENEVATQKMLESNNQYSIYNGARGAFSDSGFSYEPFDSLDSRRRRRYSRKSLRSDDMAVRKLNKQERAATITDPQAVASKISYLLTSPIYTDRLDEKLDPNEPDVTLDDVVYRNIKQLNKMKVPEHPPPFGIPLGPITLASNSDYLHAVPDTETVKPSRMPDLVKDDLAYRNLRKDNTKEPALPPVSSDDLRNNNLTNSVPDTVDISRIDLAELKKKRAVRSKSANIGSLISQEVIERASRRNARDKNVEYKTLTDIADAMQIARQVLREKERKLNETRIGSLSDTDSIYPKYSRFLPSTNYSENLEDMRDNRRENTHSSNVEDSLSEIMSSSSRKEEPTQTRRFHVKESTPDPISSFEDGKLAPLFKTNSFEDVLTALAIEAKEASDKFTQELKELDAKKYKEIDQKVECDSPKSCKKLLDAVVNIEIPKQVEKGKEEEDVIMESVATIVFTKGSQNDASIESDHDYENISSDLEQKIKETLIDETDKTESSEGMKMRDDDDYTRTISLNENANKYDIKDEDSKNESGETCVDVVMSNAFSMNITHEMSSTDFRLSHNESFVVPSYPSCSYEKSFTRIESSQSLKSPKLVLESSKLNERQNESSGQLSRTSCNSIQPSSSRSFFDVGNLSEDNYKTICFFENNNPASLAIACSYGLACLYQLAALDLYTILGIVLAMFTFIAALCIFLASSR
ncbi:uncharacterized protein LOC123671971 isoform X1 [Harmonia axyridis]|uniref:uncharacterized protein LOC123671971 isoform X1 n=2 Tax=Harmonia axyridis TaxID=115357 RepID=UPI001E277A93|nr:uncharacterized protein LOC123671971 isoform X1 [Harmonia axyridis]